MQAPNPKCIVCSEQRQAVVKIDTNRVTVKQFRDEVLVKALGMLEPDVMAGGLVLISSEEGETDCNNDKKLSELEVVDGCILKVDDFVQQYELTVVIAHKDVERDADLFEVVADPDSLKPDADGNGNGNDKAEASTSAAKDNGEPKAKKPRHEPQQAADSDDDLCIVDDDDENDRPTTSAAAATAAAAKSEPENNQMASNSSSGESTKMDTDNNEPSTSSEPRNKRPRIEQDDDDDLILIEDD